MGELVQFLAPERGQSGTGPSPIIKAVVQNNYQLPFDRGDVVLIDTAQTDLAEGFLAVLDDHYPPAELADGSSVCFYEVERKNASWFMVRRRSSNT